MDELSDDELLEALGVVVETKKSGAHTPREERVVAGFEDIVNFVKEHGLAPQHGEERDIFERLYAVRLDRLREQPEFHALLAPHDEFGLLSGKDEDKPHEPQSDDELLAELGVDIAAPDSLTVLKHVRPRVEIQAAEEIAARTPCKDFEPFKPLFDQVQKEIETGLRKHPLRSQSGRRPDQAGRVFYPRRPESLCRRSRRRVFNRTRPQERAHARHLRQRDRNPRLASLIPARSLQG